MYIYLFSHPYPYVCLSICMAIYVTINLYVYLVLLISSIVPLVPPYSTGNISFGTSLYRLSMSLPWMWICGSKKKTVFRRLVFNKNVTNMAFFFYSYWPHWYTFCDYIFLTERISTTFLVPSWIDRKKQDSTHPSLHFLLHERLENIEYRIEGCGRVDIIDSLGPHGVTVLQRESDQRLLQVCGGYYQVILHHLHYYLFTSYSKTKAKHNWLELRCTTLK